MLKSISNLIIFIRMFTKYILHNHIRYLIFYSDYTLYHSIVSKLNKSYTNNHVYFQIVFYLKKLATQTKFL